MKVFPFSSTLFGTSSLTLLCVSENFSFSRSKKMLEWHSQEAKNIFVCIISCFVRYLQPFPLLSFKNMCPSRKTYNCFAFIFIFMDFLVYFQHTFSLHRIFSLNHHPNPPPWNRSFIISLVYFSSFYCFIGIRKTRIVIYIFFRLPFLRCCFGVHSKAFEACHVSDWMKTNSRAVVSVEFL